VANGIELKSIFMNKLLLALVCICLPLAGYGQNYTIDWFKIAGGGGTSAGGSYSVSGTIGQAEAGATLNGGQYSLTGGFWGMIAAVQMAGSPLLSITKSGNGVLISWPNSGNFTLQISGDLHNDAWINSPTTVNTTNGINSVTVPLPIGNAFFRLIQSSL